MPEKYKAKYIIGAPQKILVTPLNWGLGHATRCIPIIRDLLAQGHEVYLGSDGVALNLLKKEFPELPFIELPGYKIHYKGRNLIYSLVLQSPNMLRAIIGEQRVVNDYCRKEGITTVISDNRLGSRGSDTYNIIMSHQLRVILPNKIMAYLATKLNHFWLNKYDELWVPDFAPPGNLTGIMALKDELSHVKYIGPLSRFRKLDLPLQRDIVIVLSGPEPLRTELERQLISQLRLLDHSVLLVRGIPGLNIALEDLSPNVEVAPFLTADQLNEAICSSQMVITRTGYTSVMDLIILEKPALLIPTPGQPEQEYLGQTLASHPLFVIGTQDQLDLSRQLPMLEQKSRALAQSPH